MAYNPTNNTFTTLADLAQQVGTDNSTSIVLGGTSFNDGNGGTFYWDANSTATPVTGMIVQVSGVTTGRWMRAKANAYGTNSVTFGGLALTTVYTLNHSQSFTPAQIHIQARNAGAASGISYVQNITSTTFQIVFTSVPILGTLNITFDFVAFRAN